MNSKQVIQIIISVVFLAIAGLLIYTQFGPKSHAAAGKGTKVEKITAIPASIDTAQVTSLTQEANLKDYYTAPDLNNLGNPQPFAAQQ